MVNVWTRDDLPDHDVIRDVDDMHGNGMRSVVIDLALDTVVGHLNANHQKPGQDRWRRPHWIVEQERDQARERLREVDSALAKCMSDFQDLADDSYEWKARAVAAEREVGALSERAEHLQHSRDEWKALAEADPVETKAEELFKIANPTLEWAWASGPNEEAYRRMAAHVLGQEAKR